MKLVMPDPEMKLYQTGFEGDDILDRKRFSKKLSELVEKIEDPCVIALDGAWGSGKSYFLKRWVTAHTKENSGKGLTVYFDAFEHDFLEDPLTALVGVISDRFVEERGVKRDVWKFGKTIAARLWRPALRVATAVATSGLSEATGAIADGLFLGSQAEIDKATESFWRREDGKRAAIKEFREFLIGLTAPSNGEDSNRIVVVVDELDRCRPDYALALLETIKHFFSVPNVHFVLGVNLSELENIVRARYGIQTAARDYVKKFVSIKVSLPDTKIDDRSVRDWQIILNSSAAFMQLPVDFTKEVSKQLGWIKSENISLRTIQRILGEVALAPAFQEANMAWGYRSLICGLLLLGFFNPRSLSQAKRGNLSITEVTSLFQLETTAGKKTKEDIESYRMFLIWCFALQDTQFDKAEVQAREYVQSGFGYSGTPNIPFLINEYLEFAKMSGGT